MTFSFVTPFFSPCHSIPRSLRSRGKTRKGIIPHSPPCHSFFVIPHPSPVIPHPSPVIPHPIWKDRKGMAKISIH
ncbi:hypothetical protein MYX06_02725 [Patescibacteria group bacterium AH-259-L05]|nr:hypothetical protein [Patescibacteria group bacterium AH-259-L05]